MTKSRRTRAQKAKSHLRRQQLISLTRARPSVDSKALPPAKPSKIPNKTEPVAPSKHYHDLRRSLKWVGILISFNIVLWLVFKLTNIEEYLYSLISV